MHTNNIHIYIYVHTYMYNLPTTYIYNLPTILYIICQPCIYIICQPYMYNLLTIYNLPTSQPYIYIICQKGRNNQHSTLNRSLLTLNRFLLTLNRSLLTRVFPQSESGGDAVLPIQCGIGITFKMRKDGHYHVKAMAEAATNSQKSNG